MNDAINGLAHKPTIAILGGTNGLGYWTALQCHGHFGDRVHVIITGRNEQRGQAAAHESGATYIRDNIEATRQADVVVVGVSIATTEIVIREVAPHVRDGAILADMTSIKQMPTELMTSLTEGRDILVIPLHPMFGPSTGDPTGQIVISTIVDSMRGDPRYQKLMAWLEKLGFETVEMTAEEHDRAMSVIQGATHLAIFSFIETVRRVLQESDIPFETTLKLASPVYRLLLDMALRYTEQRNPDGKPDTYSLIQISNSANRRIHEIMRTVVRDLTGELIHGVTTIYDRIGVACQEFFSRTVTQAGHYRSDAAIELLARER